MHNLELEQEGYYAYTLQLAEASKAPEGTKWAIYQNNFDKKTSNATNGVNWETMALGVGFTLMGTTALVGEFYSMLTTGTKSMGTTMVILKAGASTGARVGAATMIGLGVWDISRATQGKSSVVKETFKQPKSKKDALQSYYPYPGTI